MAQRILQTLPVRRSLDPSERAPGDRAAGGPTAQVLTRAVDCASNRAELVGRRLPDERHRDDHHGDQGHHEGVLDRGRATFLGSTVLQVVPPGGHTRVETKEHLSPPSSERSRALQPGRRMLLRQREEYEKPPRAKIPNLTDFAYVILRTQVDLARVL